MSQPRRAAVVWFVLSWCPLVGAQTALPPSDAPSPPQLSVPLAIDLVVLDRAGGVPDALAPGDVKVTINGRVRPALWVRRVSRGPGSVADAAARQVRGNPTTVFVAEPSRTALIIVDEASFPPGGERPVIQGARAFLDRLGMNDRVSVVRLPLRSKSTPVPTAERPAVRDAIGRVVGRILPRTQSVDGITADYRHIGGNPMGERASRAEPADPEDPPDLGFVNPDGSLPAGRDSLDGLIQTLEAAADLPGRKIVVFYSAGLFEGPSGRINEAIRAAAQARSSLYVFGLRAPADHRSAPPDMRPLDRLARLTGGVFFSPGSDPASHIDRLMPELSACFQVGVERTSADDGREVLELRVDTLRADLRVRAASMVAPHPMTGDDVEPPPAVAVEASRAVRSRSEEYRGAGRLSPGDNAPVLRSSRSAELDMALGRLYDYVEAYLGQYSALVAEEDYRQSAPLERRRVRLRSDLLLVKPERSEEWVSFRDVYEVNGTPVRDRDARLQRLFLSSTPEARSRLQAIKDESARHNVGPFDRNINVPMFPLKFLIPANRSRFAFTEPRTSEAHGMRTWRLEYVEQVHPTIVTDREGRDVPTRGWFLVEQATGAIVESSVIVDRPDYTMTMAVRYRPDPRLGMWVPSEMKETYRALDSVGVVGTARGIVLEGTARYSKFRRFQVTTEEKVVIPKAAKPVPASGVSRASLETPNRQ